jgi:hypothetical protein
MLETGGVDANSGLTSSQRHLAEELEEDGLTVSDEPVARRLIIEELVAPAEFPPSRGAGRFTVRSSHHHRSA